jgi:predicted nucleotidyltransferase component of viral defense system
MFHLFTVEPDTYSTLKELFKIPIINSRFALAGGTSLALQIGHRMSVDLDFFTPEPFDIEEIKNTLAACTQIEYIFIGQNSRMLFAYVNGVKCDFVQEPAKLINPFLTEEDIKIFSTEDIGAMKLQTICGRGKRKDFFDIYALLNRYTWGEMLSWFEKKYSTKQYYFLWRSITYFEDAENDAIVRGFPPFSFSWDEIKKFLQKKCTEV